ncbi:MULTISPECIES: RNase H family protein [Agrobacterium]|uniref:RNase H family protein n=1 Tax=Agrobacterium TaxID=357 RepID=UPI003594225F
MRLWQELDALLQRNLRIRIQFWKGHSGVEGNGMADMAARGASQRRRQRRSRPISWARPLRRCVIIRGH